MTCHSSCIAAVSFSCAVFVSEACSTHADCPSVQYCASGRRHTNGVRYASCEALHECSEFHDAVDFLCPQHVRLLTQQDHLCSEFFHDDGDDDQATNRCINEGICTRKCGKSDKVKVGALCSGTCDSDDLAQCCEDDAGAYTGLIIAGVCVAAFFVCACGVVYWVSSKKDAGQTPEAATGGEAPDEPVVGVVVGQPVGQPAGPPVGQPAVAKASGTGLAAELEKLQDLKERGVLSESEFQQAKDRVLGKSPGASQV